jgi:hypothetical protein
MRKSVLASIIGVVAMVLIAIGFTSISNSIAAEPIKCVKPTGSITNVKLLNYMECRFDELDGVSAPTPTPTTPSTTPTPTPTVTTPTPGGTYPDATTTGHRGTLIRATTSTIDKPGVYENLEFTNGLTLVGSGITLRNVKIVGRGWTVVNARQAPGAIIDKCTIDGEGAGEGSHGVSGVFGQVSNCDIKGVENGITPEGSGQKILKNYIHDLKAPGSPHYDGIQVDGGQSDMLIEGNTILNPFTQTAAIMIDNYFGPIKNIVVRGNRLGGGGYTVYSDGQFTGGAIEGVQFVNNRMKKGYYGYKSVNKNTPVWSGNVDDLSGAPI